MEGSEIISEEWSSLTGFYTSQESDFMSQIQFIVPQEYEYPFGNNNNNNLSPEVPSSSTFWSSGIIISDTESTLQFPPNVVAHDDYDDDVTHCYNLASMSMGFPYSVHRNELGTDKDDQSLKNLQAKVDWEAQVYSEPEKEDRSSNMGNLGKRVRSSVEISKKKRNIKSKKNPETENFSSCSSEDDSSASQELINGGTSSCLSPENNTNLKLNGKLRSNKSPSTEPQSVYARRRRERINERLRILQTLVPNGTKVDISTMLEGAVQYVKFLQLQIKLLSSDDLWMYAQIAYNGLNIGIDLNITPTK